ncbi:hypothetical protein EVAR_37482_1 [Eumeta japonica]|uniref:Uncharacterized protein n=1 Tax=Eumeta variegata TaxID=151549 RepID=A0A4C1XBJ4_EUMVA|nr:hypothetical protein EVAR_37482_1 [Eumeta japonica]
MRELIFWVTLLCVCATFLFCAGEALPKDEHLASAEEVFAPEVTRTEDQEKKDGRVLSVSVALALVGKPAKVEVGISHSGFCTSQRV